MVRSPETQLWVTLRGVQDKGRKMKHMRSLWASIWEQYVVYSLHNSESRCSYCRLQQRKRLDTTVWLDDSVWGLEKHDLVKSIVVDVTLLLKQYSGWAKNIFQENYKNVILKHKLCKNCAKYKCVQLEERSWKTWVWATRNQVCVSTLLAWLWTLRCSSFG